MPRVLFALELKLCDENMLDDPSEVVTS
jgi:hypothetical protein